MSMYLFRNNPHFGMDLADDFLLPLTFSHLVRNELQRQRSKEGQPVARPSPDGFQVEVDVKQFLPEEITVKVVDRFIIVEGKHEERLDEHGFVSRQFTRRYLVPEDCDLVQVASKLSSDGVLTLCAPKLAKPDDKERIIPIIHAGPHRKELKPQDKQETKDTEKMDK